jgi:LuxR family maltose regulon positive regulatory protein
VIVALGGKNLSEERLMDVLWPDAEGDSGRNALSVTLSRLRELLGVKDALQVSEGMVSLDDRFVWTDAWAFERLIRAAERETEKREDLEKAFELYHGHFLKAESGSWAISPRERLRESFLRAIESLGAHWERNEEWQKAVEVYRKGVQADDLIEKCYIRMMSCLLRLGSRAEALSVYRRLKKTLNGYGVEPSAEAEELHRQIISSNTTH